MTRLSSSIVAAAIAISSGTTSGFMLPFPTQDQQQHLLAATANDDTDFDAPVLKNPVMKANTVLDHEIEIVDDECYLGKYGQYESCVDFGKLIVVECIYL